MPSEGSNAAVQLVFDPFGRASRKLGALIAAFVMVAGVVIARMGVRFDGFLDVHLTGRAVPVGVAVLDQLVAVPLGVCVGWVVARLFRAEANIFDLLCAVAIARIPPLVGAPLLAALVPDPRRIVAEALAASPVALLLGALALPMIAWQVTLLVFGVRHATRLRSGRLAGAVVTLIVAAELLSKIVLSVA
jgi:hypothetical protein